MSEPACAQQVSTDFNSGYRGFMAVRLAASREAAVLRQYVSSGTERPVFRNADAMAIPI